MMCKGERLTIATPLKLSCKRRGHVDPIWRKKKRSILVVSCVAMPTDSQSKRLDF